MAKARHWAYYTAIWRWHFYAGLFCVPFVVLLAITGSIYLFKPQIDAWADRPYNHLAMTGKPATARAQVLAALSAVPGSSFISYGIPGETDDAAQIMVGAATGAVRVYVHPETAQVLQSIREDERLTNVVKTIHGELLLGDRGSLLVELAASWAIVMIVTGLYLWWPRRARGLAGVVWPRLGSGGRIFWRDLHAVTGIWISGLALFLLLSGLPWTTVWGGAFKDVQQWAQGPAPREQAWSSGRSAEHPMSQAAGGHSDHAQHGDASMDASGPVGLPPTVALDAMIASVRTLRLPPPVLIAAPSRTFPQSDDWTARNDTQNRPQQVVATLHPETGAIQDRKDFGSQPLVDRIVGYGIAAHEGQLFGLANQLLGLLTAAGLITLSVTGYVMWWKRRPAGRLGAPPTIQDARIAPGIAVAVVALGLFLPMMGISLIAVALLERLVRACIPPSNRGSIPVSASVPDMADHRSI